MQKLIMMLQSSRQKISHPCLEMFEGIHRLVMFCKEGKNMETVS